MRAFIAIDLPGWIRDRLREVQDKLKGKQGSKISWPRPDGIHLTIKFLGDIEEKEIEEIGKVLERVAEGIAPFRLSVEGVGAFPTISNPRVIWVGVKTEGENLLLLRKGLEEGFAQLGFEKETRPFQPHLTLGRIKYLGDKKGFIEGYRALGGIKLGGFLVEGIVLFKSELKPTGAVYTRLKEVMFKIKMDCGR